jgi:hypothetical protein
MMRVIYVGESLGPYLSTIKVLCMGSYDSLGAGSTLESTL